MNVLRHMRRGLLVFALVAALLPTAAFAGGWGDRGRYGNNNDDVPSNWEGHHSTWDNGDDSSSDHDGSYGGRYGGMYGRGYWGYGKGGYGNSGYGKGGFGNFGYGHNADYGRHDGKAQVYWSGNDDSDDDKCDDGYGRWAYGRRY
jgi:hypothetical protein